jgi:hypothetical protein
MDIKIKGLASRSLPQAVPDTTETEPRYGRYGDQYNIGLMQDYYGLADEGCYFIATNPTPGTGIAFGNVSGVSGASSDTVPGLIIQNIDQSPSGTVGKRIYLDYIKLICTAAVAGASASPFYQMMIKTDNTLSRYTSGGTLITPVNSNMDVGSPTISKVIFGTPTAAAASSAARLLARIVGRGATLLPGINDTLIINFGSVEKASGNQNLSQAAPAGLLYNVPPVVLGPGSTMTLHGWTPATFTTVPSFEFEMGWFER